MPRPASITTDMFDYTFGPSMPEKFDLFRRVGFRHVHWCDDWDNERCYSRGEMDGFAERLVEAGLRCIDVHGTATRRARIDAPDHEGHDLYVRLLKNRIEFCRHVGGDAVVVHPPYQGRTGFIGRDRLARVIRAFEAVRPICEKTGVRLAVENMGNRSSFSVDVLDWFYGEFPAGFVGWCLDSGHSHQAGDFERLKPFAERLLALHLHDNHGDRDEHQPPFFGTIDWAATMAWLGGTGYAKPINFEVTHRTEHFDGTMHEYIDYVGRSVERAMALLA
ncbi:MAG: sugar phosphate isomerase/epimerase [Phycisphaerae bacterium]|nr:sugar phosphate isomerase/epimerase [Phycisphaerae bacterium]